MLQAIAIAKAASCYTARFCSMVCLSVCLSVDHNRVLCKNGYDTCNRDAVWAGEWGGPKTLYYADWPMGG